MLFRKPRWNARPPAPEATGGTELASARALVDAVYVGLLSRPATEREIEQGCLVLDSGRSLSEVIASVMAHKLFFGRLSDAQEGRAYREDKLMNDVSQNGEVEILLKRIVNAACPHQTLVDVGANGVTGSNSYDLLRYFRWRGVLIEANPRLIDKIRQDFSGLDCEVEACAVSDFEGEASFSIGASDGVSSLDEAATASWGPVADRVSVPVRRLASVLEQHSVPLDFDLLSLDIEHHDVRVLNDLVATSAYRPKWIIMEAPAGAFLNDPKTAGCSTAVQTAYTMVDTTMANFILRRTVDGPA